MKRILLALLLAQAPAAFAASPAIPPFPPAILVGSPILGSCGAGQFVFNSSGAVGCSGGTPSTFGIPQAATGGVSGGIPYFSNTTTVSASALLTANAIVLGGGAGNPPATTTTGTGVVTAMGSTVNTNGGLLTAATAAIAANAIVTGAGSGTALTGTTPGTNVLTALGVNTESTGAFARQNGAITAGNCLKWSATGIQDFGATCGGSIVFPQTIGGTANSGGIPYFSNATTLTSSAALAANALVIGGGAGVAPSTTTTGTGVLTGIASAVNTNGGILTASTAAVAANAIVTGAGSGTALTGTTPGTGVLTALGQNVNGSGAISLTTSPTFVTPVLGAATATSVAIGGSTALTANAAAADVITGTSGGLVVTPTAISGSAAPFTLTDGATINWNVQSGYNSKLTLTASGHTLANPTNVVLGYTYVVVINPSTFTMSFDTAYDWGGAGAPALTASKDNLIACYAKGTSGANSLYCVANLGF